MGAQAEGWRAVHVGLLDFDFLDQETGRRWLSEECPGQQLPEEVNDRRIEPHNSYWETGFVPGPAASARF